MSVIEELINWIQGDIIMLSIEAGQVFRRTEGILIINDKVKTNIPFRNFNTPYKIENLKI